MKVLHTADWHLGEYPGPVINGENARLLDIVRCLDYLVETAEAEKPDAILIAGDLFNKAQQWATPMLHLIDIAASRLRALAAVAPTVLMYGTANHDNLQAFENIRAMQIIDLYVVTTPKLFPIFTTSGPLQIAAIPGLDKGHFRAKHPGMDPAEENQTCSRLLGDLVLGMGAEVDPLLPSVLMSHYAVAGCEYDNGQQHIFTQNEVILPKEAIAAIPFDLVCLGHIHKAQEVEHCGRPVFYCGALNGLTFNEEGQDKGFWMHEIEAPWGAPEIKATPGDYYDADGSYGGFISRFIKTPYREFLTETWSDLNVENVINYLDADPSWLFGSHVKDKIIRVHYSCSEEQNKRLNRKAVEKALYDAGAFYVAEIKPEKINAGLVKQELTENAGPLENLRAWCKAEGFTPEDTLALEILARPLIDMVSARQPSGKLSGVFVPRTLTVKNYRSYREASFDFDPITFAMVNGPNGVGKSALFMDSISDCLYEETREDELTGWITNGEKSGMITFEFSMGESTWRVIRTRARSGKTTVSLQEQTDGEWTDRSAEKVRDTQEKIVALLGMDAMTFRCCGLIMQDAYGLYLEADREDRMGVLGNILGLGIYELLEKLAKEKVTDTNRELSRAKDKLAELGEKLKGKPGLSENLIQTGAEIAKLTGDVAGMEAELKEAEEKVRVLEAKAEKAEELRKRVVELEREAQTRRDEKAAQETKMNRALEMLSKEDDIIAKAQEYQTVKEQVAALKAKKPRLDELGREEVQLIGNIGKVNGELKRLGIKVRETENFLKDKERIEKGAQEYRDAVEALKNIEDTAGKHNTLREQVLAIEKVTDKIAEPLTGLYAQLKTCREKVEILNNSGCIDPEKATCNFLADAVASKDMIPKIEAEVKDILDQRKPLDEQVAAIEKGMDALGYSHEEHYRLKRLVETLRPFSEKAAQLEVMADMLDNLREQVGKAEGEIKQHNERLASVREQVQQLREEIDPLPEMEARLPKLEAWVKAKEQLPAAREIVKAATERIKTLDAEIADRQDQVKAAEKERDVLMDAVIIGNLDITKGQVVTLKDNLDTTRKLQNELHAKQGAFKAKIEALEKDEAERRQVAEQMEPLAAALVQYQTLAKAFGQDGIPFSIVRTVVPELSAQANEILGQMTGGKMSLEMRTERIQKSSKKEVNALEIFITDYQWGTMPYKSRSGGQKVRGALSVAFALAELKASRAGIRLGMIFIDESPYLDAEGSEAYYDAIELVSQKYSDMKVLAISHDPAVQARFPQIILVTDEGEAGSKVRLVA